MPWKGSSRAREWRRNYYRKRYHEDAEFREKTKQWNKRWQQKNPEKVKAIRRRCDKKRRAKQCENNRRRIIRKKLELVKNLGGKCSLCGYNKNLAALTFHHRNGLNIKRYSTPYLNWVHTEPSQLILLCHNCHAELHNPQLHLNSQGKLMTG